MFQLVQSSPPCLAVEAHQVEKHPEGDFYHLRILAYEYGKHILLFSNKNL